MDVSVIITSPPLAKTVPAPAGQPDRRRDGLVVAHQEAAELKGRPGAG
jgi:hypothetical protein